MKSQYDKAEVIIYLNTNKVITANGLRQFANLSKQTANDIIKRYVRSGNLMFDGTMKVKGQKKPLPKYKLIMEISTYDKVVTEFLRELKEKRTQVMSPNDGDSDSSNREDTPSAMSPNVNPTEDAMSPNDIDLRSKDQVPSIKDLEAKVPSASVPSGDSDLFGLIEVWNTKARLESKPTQSVLAEFDKVFGDVGHGVTGEP